MGHLNTTTFKDIIYSLKIIQTIKINILKSKRNSLLSLKIMKFYCTLHKEKKLLICF